MPRGNVAVVRPEEGVIGAVPEYLRSPDEDFWLEQAAIDDAMANAEAGERPPSIPISGEWATVQEVAARHRVSAKTIRARIHDGSLKAVDHSPAGSGVRQRRYRVHRDAEAAWVEAKGAQRRTRTARKTKARGTFKGMVQR